MERGRRACGLIAALLTLAPGTPGRADPDAAAQPARSVRTARVELRDPGRELRLSGTIRAARRSELAFALGGRLMSRSERGRRVRSGEVIAQIDPFEYENAVLEADAEVQRSKLLWRRARREGQRIAQLFAVGGRTERDLDEARASEDAARVRVSAAEARLREAERRLDETSLRAPFAGVVSEILREAGEHAGPGEAVAVVSADSDLEVAFQLPEGLVHRVRLGDEVAVLFPLADTAPLRARVSSVTYVAPEPGALFPALARLGPGSGAAPGMSAEIVIRTREQPGLLVPLDAIVDPTGDAPAVFRVAAGRAQRVAVEVGALVNGRVVVRGALEPGDAVVVGGSVGLLDGEPVEPPPPAAPE